MPRRKTTTSANKFRKPLTVMVKFGTRPNTKKVAHTYSTPGKPLYQKYLRNGYKPVMEINGWGHKTPVIDNAFETDKAGLR